MCWKRIRKPFVGITFTFREIRFWKIMHIFKFEQLLCPNRNSYSVACPIKLFYEPFRMQRYKLLLHFEHLNMFKQWSKGKGHPKCTHFCSYLSINFQNYVSRKKSDYSTRCSRQFPIGKHQQKWQVTFCFQYRNERVWQNVRRRQWCSGVLSDSVKVGIHLLHILVSYRRCVSSSGTVRCNGVWLLPLSSLILFRILHQILIRDGATLPVYADTQRRYDTRIRNKWIPTFTLSGSGSHDARFAKLFRFCIENKTWLVTSVDVFRRKNVCCIAWRSQIFF